MQNSRSISIFFLLLASIVCQSQNPDAIKNYITTYKDLAIDEMQRTGVPASITLAQGIHESTAGTSNLVQQSNNHFGIKCKSNWTGESVKHDDDARGECFRKYREAAASYKDHSDFLKSGQRYAFLFQLDPTDYAGWANGLKKAGYATNPKYPAVLIKLIEDYHLQDYTMIALNKTQITPEEKLMTVLADEQQFGNVVAPVEVPQEELNRLQKEVLKKSPVYPQGRFLLNDTKVVYAAKGTSFLAIAKEYDVDLSKIFEFNELPQMDIVTEDQLIYLQRKRRTGNNEFHIVQPGESLHDIAQSEAIRLETLAAYNFLRGDEIVSSGEQLSLKKKSAAMPKLAVKANYSIVPAMKK